MRGPQEILEPVPGDAWSLLTNHSYQSWSKNSHSYGDSWPESHVLKSQRYLSFLQRLRMKSLSAKDCQALSGRGHLAGPEVPSQGSTTVMTPLWPRALALPTSDLSLHQTHKTLMTSMRFKCGPDKYVFFLQRNSWKKQKWKCNQDIWAGGRKRTPDFFMANKTRQSYYTIWWSLPFLNRYGGWSLKTCPLASLSLCSCLETYSREQCLGTTLLSPSTRWSRLWHCKGGLVCLYVQYSWLPWCRLW